MGHQMHLDSGMVFLFMEPDLCMEQKVSRDIWTVPNLEDDKSLRETSVRFKSQTSTFSPIN